MLIPKLNPIHMIVSYPESDDGKRTLARRMAGVYAEWVCEKIKKLNCPAEQKMRLCSAVMASTKRKRDQAR